MLRTPVTLPFVIAVLRVILPQDTGAAGGDQ
jgi:hypothetical protein